MRVRLPVYVEGPGGEDAWLVRFLFHPEFEERGPRLARVTGRLEERARGRLDDLRAQGRPDGIVGFAFCPALDARRLSLEVPLRRRTLRLRLLVVQGPPGERRFAGIPAVPGLWFDLERGEDLGLRAADVLARHLRGLPEVPARLQDERPAWLSEMALEVDFAPRRTRAGRRARAFLGDAEVADGATELRRVGRRLDAGEPDEAGECLLREREVQVLLEHLAAPERTSLALLGPRRVGKTAVALEAIRRHRRAGRRGPEFWHLSPQRLISGMSYVGQWEGRLLAILRYARRHGHVLVLDDLPGLFLAGRSAQSDLTLGDVLKPWLERREVRLLGEVTPEGLRALRERDRGFADLLRVVPVAETDGPGTLRVALSVVRRVERQQGCSFTPEAVAAALDLHRRHVTDAVFPGKVAGFLAQVGVRHRGGEVDRERVLEELRARTGLSLALLDERLRLERRDVVRALSARVVGQDEAVGAMADAVSVARARLQDPDRPLASLLFVGPPGVGKTECARALAHYLYGDEDRLVRFDLNEYGSWDAAARLVGTFERPEGALTAELRRRPHCVLLLDEVEKAHPDVLGLLLQVLGEGRLTDALGRTADFRRALVILTSNLGSQESSHPLGLRAPDEVGEGLVHRRAVEGFFSPELFNRLDRVVPFRPLGRDEIRRIARLLLDRVLGREGLVRRRCVLEVPEEALDLLAREGTHPHLGARALRRAVDRELVGPLAERLAAMAPDAAVLVALEPAGDRLAPRVLPLEPVAERGFARDLPPPGADLAAVLAWVEDGLAGLEAALQARAPAGPVGADDLTEAHLLYFAARDRLREVGSVLRRLRGAPASATRRAPVRRGAAAATRRRALPRAAGAWRAVLGATDLRTALRDFAREAPEPGDREADLQELLRERALLVATLEEPSDRVSLRPEAGPGPASARAAWLADLYREVLPGLGLEVLPSAGPEVSGAGPAAARLLAGERGLHLFLAGEGVLLAVRVGPDAEPRVVRLYDAETGTLDLRTGFLAPGLPDAEALRSLLLGGL